MKNPHGCLKCNEYAARLAEAVRLLGESVHCVESWKRKHERALKAATKKADADYMEWHAEQVTAAVDLLAKISEVTANSASGVTP